jgi:CDP-4-dehydro-6-deoxyglucose reductase
VASCPCDDRNLLFHISRDQAEQGDEFAARLFAGAVRAGDAINVHGPWGDFVLRQDTGRSLAFLCCDTGFAPMRSLVEHALALDTVAAMALYWAATRPGGQYLANQCRAWADALDDFRYRALDAIDGTAAGAAAAGALVADLGEAGEWDIYVAGPEAFVQAALAALRAAGVAEAGLRAVVL